MTLDELHQHGFDASSEDDNYDRDDCTRLHISVHCSQCEALVLNGVPTHEHGCPNTPYHCRECGSLHPSRQLAAECCNEEYREFDETDLALGAETDDQLEDD